MVEGEGDGHIGKGKGDGRGDVAYGKLLDYTLSSNTRYSEDYGMNAASFMLGRLGLVGADNVYINVRIPGTKELADNLHITLPSGFTAEAYFNMLFAEGKQKNSISSYSLPAVMNFFEDDLQVDTTYPRRIDQSAQPAKILALKQDNTALSAQLRAEAADAAKQRAAANAAEQQREAANAAEQQRVAANAAKQQREAANAAEQLRAEAVQKQKEAVDAAKQRAADARAAAEEQQRVAQAKVADVQAKAAELKGAEERIQQAKQDLKTKQKNAQELKEKAENEAIKRDALIQKHADAVDANKKAKEDLEKANELAKEAKEAKEAADAAQQQAEKEGLDDAAKQQAAEAAKQQAEALKQAEARQQAAKDAADKAALEAQQALEAKQALEAAAAKAAAAKAAVAAAAAEEEVAIAAKAQLEEEAKRANEEAAAAKAEAEAAAEKAKADAAADAAAEAEAAAEIQQLAADAERLAIEAAEAERLEKEAAEAQRLAKEAADAQVEAERLAAADAQRLAAERLAAADAQRLAAERLAAADAKRLADAQKAAEKAKVNPKEIKGITLEQQTAIFAKASTPQDKMFLEDHLSVLKTDIIAGEKDDYVPPGSASIVKLDDYSTKYTPNVTYNVTNYYDSNSKKIITKKVTSFNNLIKFIIQAAPAISGSANFISNDSIKHSVYNCLYLAEKHNVKKIAFPIIGGKIFFDKLVEINGASFTKNDLYKLLLQGVSAYFEEFTASSIENVLFAVSTSNEYPKNNFKSTFNTFVNQPNNSHVFKKLTFSTEDIFKATDTYNNSNKTNPITALVNAANIELEFGGGLSQEFRVRVNQIYPEINTEGINIIKIFNAAKNLYLKDATINPTPSPFKPDPDFVPPAPLPPPKPQPPPVVTGGQRYSNAELVTTFRVTNEVDANSYNNTNKKVGYNKNLITDYELAYWKDNTCFFDGFLMIFLIHRNTFLFDTLFYNDNEVIRTYIHKIVGNMDTTTPYHLGEQNKMKNCLVLPGVLERDGWPDDSQRWLNEFLINLFLSAEQRAIIEKADAKISFINAAKKKLDKAEAELLKANEADEADEADKAAKKTLQTEAKAEYDNLVDERAILFRNVDEKKDTRAFLQQESSNPSNSKECKEYMLTIEISSEHQNQAGKIDKISEIYNTKNESKNVCRQYKIRNYNFPIIFNVSVGGDTDRQVIPDEALIINNFIYELIGINTKASPGHYVYFIKDPDSLTWYYYDDTNYKSSGLQNIGNYESLLDNKKIKENTLESVKENGNSYTFIYYPNKLMVQHHKALNTLEDKFKQTLEGEQVNPSNYTLIGTKISGEYLKLCCNIGIANANIIRQIHTSIPERQGKKIEQKNITEISNIFQQQKGKADPVQSMIDQYGQKLAIFYDNADYVIYNERWSRLLRQCVLQETLCAFASTFDTMTYHEIAHYNMIRFKEKSQWKEIEQSEPTFGIIKVIKSDTLDAALCATKIFGEMFTVLNMANATGFGGGYTHGRSAQEENIFRRTDCHFSMRREHLSFKRPGKYKYTYQYEDDGDLTMTQRINRGIVFKDQPRVCIRRGESLVPSGNISPVKILQLIHYKWLDYYDIFQFYEMRNAARDYRDEDYNPFYIAKKDKQGKDDNTTKDPISDADAKILYNKVDKEIKAANKLDEYVEDAKKAALQAKGKAQALFEAGKAAVAEAKKTMAQKKDVDALEDANKKKLEPLEKIANEALLKEIVSDMKTRIINQLTQLIENNCEYVILSAFGCGAFHNHPIVVSNLYKEIFESVYDKVTPKKTYREHFKVIIFAIYQNNPKVDNSSQFKILENIENYPPNVQALFAELQALLTQLDSPDPSPPP
jgi:hypothetical protein